jgi:hypothetical protein
VAYLELERTGTLPQMTQQLREKAKNESSVSVLGHPASILGTSSFQMELSSNFFITGYHFWLLLRLHCCSYDQVDKSWMTGKERVNWIAHWPAFLPAPGSLRYWYVVSLMMIMSQPESGKWQGHCYCVFHCFLCTSTFLPGVWHIFVIPQQYSMHIAPQ